MSIPGLSLFGFLEEQEALRYLRTACIAADPSPEALRAVWASARIALGPPMPSAGTPDIADLPAGHQSCIAQLNEAYPYIAAEGWRVQMVQIEPLLAYQHHISLSRSARYCGQESVAPSLDELVTACLPAVRQPPPAEPPGNQRRSADGTESVQVEVGKHGMMNAGSFGIVVGASAPQVQVVRCKGRCYLRNGFHRAFGMCRRGATHLPSLFRETDDYAYLGIRADGTTFGRQLMESGNPPTVGHFTQGRATPVHLRKASRIVQVNWDKDATRCFVRCDIVREGAAAEPGAAPSRPDDPHRR